MRRTILLLVLAASLLVAIACSKKSAPPTAPPAPPACAVSRTSIDFGSVPVGSASNEQTFVLSNTGGGTLTGTVSESCADFQFSGGQGGYAIPGGSTRTVKLVFTPLNAGSTSCVVTTGCSQNVTLTGVGVQTCSLQPTNLDFGEVTVGSSTDRTFTLTNAPTGSLAGTITESCPEFSIVGSATYNLGPGHSATFTVRFAPSGPGARACTINTGNPGCPTIAASGTGVAVSTDCQVTPNALGFGDTPIGSRLDATFTIRNNGTGRLIGSVSESCPEFSIPGATAYDLAPGASQTFIVRFEPTTIGPKLCTVNTGTGCLALPVSGNGIMGCAFQPTVLDFGLVPYDFGGYREFTLTNNTNQPLVGTFYPPPYFTVRTLSGVVNTFSVGPQQSQVFGVSFVPLGDSRCDTTRHEGRILTDHALCSTIEVRGTGAWKCDCSFSPTILNFGNIIVGETSASQTVTLRTASPRQLARTPIRVISGDFVVPATMGCVSCGPVCTLNVPIQFRPQTLGPQVGKIVFDRPDGCFVGGTRCDTLTVTGTGVTVVTGRR